MISTRRNFMKTVARATMALGLDRFSTRLGAEQSDQKYPNILFVYLDDLGYGDLSCYNPKSKIHTPNIDRLARQGARFTDAHAAAAICGPSRYGLLTGRYPWRRGDGGMGNGAKFRDTFIEKGRLTLASLLKKKDYNTAQMGKWGLRHYYSDAVKPGMKPGTRDSYDFPNKRLLGSQKFGFDYSWCMTHLFPRDGAKEIDIYNKHQFENGLPVDPDLKMSDVHRWLPDSAMKVVEYIDVYAGKKKNDAFGVKPDKPFFIYWDPPSPHLPLVPNKEFIGKSSAGAYGDFVVEIDHYVGKMLDALDRHGLTDNTLVVFASDNGPEDISYDQIKEYKHYSMGELRGVKRDAWEGGHRVPLIVRWPGMIEPGRTNDELVSLTDWLATFADITRQTLPEDAGEDSVSLLPLLQGKKLAQPVRDHVIHHTPQGAFAIRLGDWLFIDNKTGGARDEPEWFRKERGVQPHACPGELFNLKADPQQTVNLYATHPDKIKEMKKFLKRYTTSDRSRD